MRLQLAQQERAFLLKEKQHQEDHSKEISALKQENYMLQCKVNKGFMFIMSLNKLLLSGAWQ